ncbi:AraC family transcriptional regulator [Ruegeria sp. R14_0]|uniref:AraC family transcriptional regulator n=1 Tax=Ruegeria sp. R14_0 TaxID=2821100 RepID=UPI001AD956F2|nr:AraC family transcriptional regulator [Ruegeria sp. R14_0]MBO9445785.1 AraC family transcriptional regulator ligand-binding domain-containing protein [Ruegeria sp. R14_0]
MQTRDRIKTPDTFWKALESLSISRAVLMRDANLPSRVFSSEGRMTTRQLFAMWEVLQTLGGDDIGLAVTETMHEATLPPSFLVAFHAKNVGEALYRVARFKALCAPEEFRVAVEGDGCAVTTAWTYAKQTEPDALTDATFTFLVNMVRAGTGQTLSPKGIELRRSRSERLETWYDCPISWNAPHARITFNKADLEIPFTSYNSELLAMLDAALNADLNKAENSTSLTDQVRWHLRRALTAGRPELRSIARDMAISERSLQRHLKSEGHSFKSLLSDTRRQLAREYLDEPYFDISEIAYLLGYEDQGSFYRAFQKWEHQTPAEWRSRIPDSPDKVPNDT